MLKKKFIQTVPPTTSSATITGQKQNSNILEDRKQKRGLSVISKRGYLVNPNETLWHGSFPNFWGNIGTPKPCEEILSLVPTWLFSFIKIDSCFWMGNGIVENNQMIPTHPHPNKNNSYISERTAKDMGRIHAAEVTQKWALKFLITFSGIFYSKGTWGRHFFCLTNCTKIYGISEKAINMKTPHGSIFREPLFSTELFFNCCSSGNTANSYMFRIWDSTPTP